MNKINGGTEGGNIRFFHEPNNGKKEDAALCPFFFGGFSLELWVFSFKY